MSFQVAGGDGTSILAVDPISKAARVTMYDDAGNSLISTRGEALPEAPAFIPMGGYNDKTFRMARFDRLGTFRTGFDNLLFHDDVEGTTINTQLWTAATTTFTQAQTAASGIAMNSASTLAANSASQIMSQKYFSKTQLSPLRMRTRVRVAWQNNSIAEFGFGVVSGVVAQIACGAFWRYTSTGSVVPVLAFNGSDVWQGTDISAGLLGTNAYSWSIFVDDDNVFFTCQNAATGLMVAEQTAQLPAAQLRMWNVTHLPVFHRLYVTSTAAPAAPLMFVGDTAVVGYDLFVNKPWTHQLAASSAGGGEVNPTTFAQTAQWTNSAAATSATLSNTAAGYTTLGGIFQFAAVAGAETDYALFGFTVPSPYSFYCTGIHIATFNMGAAVATTPTLLNWAVANNSSAITLAGTINRTPIGSQCLPLAAPIGQSAADIEIPFDVPLRTDAARLLQIILRMPVGTATASQIIRGMVTIRGYFE